MLLVRYIKRDFNVRLAHASEFIFHVDNYAIADVHTYVPISLHLLWGFKTYNYCCIRKLLKERLRYIFLFNLTLRWSVKERLEKWNFLGNGALSQKPHPLRVKFGNPILQLTISAMPCGISMKKGTLFCARAWSFLHLYWTECPIHDYIHLSVWLDLPWTRGTTDSKKEVTRPASLEFRSHVSAFIRLFRESLGIRVCHHVRDTPMRICTKSCS